MTLAELATFVGTKIGMTDAATLTKIKSWATQRYAGMYAGALWKDALSVYSFNLTAGQSTLILPYHIAQFVASKYDDNRLVPVDASFLFNSNPGLWDDLGTPTHCSELAPVAIRTTNPYPDYTLRFVSSHPSDTQDIVLYGETPAGDPLSERITLTGVTPKHSVGIYGTLFTLSKPVTTGWLYVFDNPGDNLLLELAADERGRSHRRIRLHATPQEALTLAVLAKRHPAPFTADDHVTALPPICDQALQALVHGDALEWQQQYGKAQAKFAEGLALMDSAKRAETYQAAHALRMTPADGLADGCSPYDFL